MTAPVTLDCIGHRFGDFRALHRIDLEIAAGEYITLLGPSGCGKTTLLSILGGFFEPSEGRVLIGGRDVTALTAAKRPTATTFQDYALFPHMSLRDNVAFGLRMAGMGRRERHARAEEKLDMVGLKAQAGNRPHELSGGQRQRVALARALAVEPDVLLLDEPLGALDLKLRRAMQDELKNIQRRVGTTFVHVTHDQEEAMAIADRIVVMNAGRIEDVGPPARIYRHPASLFAAEFMGEMNRFGGEGRGGRCDRHALRDGRPDPARGRAAHALPAPRGRPAWRGTASHRSVAGDRRRFFRHALPRPCSARGGTRPDAGGPLAAHRPARAGRNPRPVRRDRRSRRLFRE